MTIMYKTLRNLAIVCFGMLLSNSIYAEGSKQLTPDTLSSTISGSSKSNRYIGFLQHDDNGGGQPRSFGFLKPSTNPFFEPSHRLKVHLEPGDTLFYGLRRIPTNESGNQADLIIKLRVEIPGAGVFTVRTDTLKRNQSSTKQSKLLAQAGVINSKAENQVGPLYYTSGSTVDFNRPVGGYNALYEVNTTSSPLEVFFEFTQTSSTATQKSWYDLWDFTVRNNGEKKGRLYSKLWSFSAGSFSNRLSQDFTLFPAIPDNNNPTKFYIQSINFAGMQPFGFAFVANDSGTSKPAGDYIERRKSDDTFDIYEEFDVFVNNPDTNFKPNAQDGFFFAYANRVICIENQRRAVVNYYVDKRARIVFFINFNGIAGFQPNTTDVLIEAIAPKAGNYNLFWDLRKGDGSLVADGANIEINIKAMFFPSHFPLWDIENNDVGLLVQNVRPSSSSKTLEVFWDDSKLDSATYPTFEPRVNLVGLDASSQRRHTWSGNDGDEVNVNTFYFGSSVDTTFQTIITYECDIDNDGIDNGVDIDDDNDGITNLDEMFGIDPFGDADNDSIPNYLDVNFVHPTLGAYRDVNIDLINDIFDTDYDGVPNFLDLDADGDGIFDIIEADSPDGTPAVPNSSKNFDRGNISNSSGVSTVGTNGMPDAAETNTDNGVTRYALTDSDGDGVPNFLDIDSDNDGILDNTEVLPNYSTNVPNGVDADGDGISDNYDPECNGTPAQCASFVSGTRIIPVNTDSADLPDYLDLDSDNDGLSDYADNADENGNGFSSDDLNARGLTVNSVQGATVYPQADNDGNGVPDYLMLVSGTNRPAFTTVGNSTFSDINRNGLVDLYDSVAGGFLVFPADVNSNGIPDWREAAVANPLPVELVAFTGTWTPAGSLLEWKTASEENNAGFNIERSVNGTDWEDIGFISGHGTTPTGNDYNFLDVQAPNAGVVYYRLRQEDYDGTTEHTYAVQIQRVQASASPALKVYPNPSGDGVITIAGTQAGDQVSILTAQGATILVETSSTVSGAVTIDVTSLAPGMYFIQVNGQARELIKFVKQ